MKNNTKIIIGVVILIPIIALIGGIIWFETTTISVDELKQEQALYNEAVENGTINNTTERDELEKEYEESLSRLKGSKERTSNILNN
jgi:membrane-associated protease RseP (regulator of RpoE activity)